MSQLDGASVLITGGTGSLGKSLVEYLLKETKVRRIAVFSRDELKQQHLRIQFKDDPRLRWFLGDVRDLDRLKRAFHGVDYVIHAAALKQVDTGEYNPMEFIKTNVLGSQNVIDASIDAGVSVIPFFQEIAAQGKPIPITDLRMTRFWISIESAVKFVVESLEIMTGGELYVPRIPSMKIVDLANAVAPGSKLEEIGMRPGEKLHEEMISADDSRRTIILESRFVVTPVVAEWGYLPPKGSRMPEGQAYRSDTNDLWMSESDIKNFIKIL